MGCVSSQIFEEDETKRPVKKPIKNPNIITGDITKKNESKLERERAMRLRQEERIAAAEEISLRTIEEKERLSLGTRSRGTSRVSSRAGSPTPGKKVHFKNEDITTADKKTISETTTNQVQYTNTNSLPKDEGKQSKTKKKKNSKNMVEPSDNAVTSNGTITNNNTGEPNDKEVKKLKKTLSTIDERSASRSSGKLDETKR